MYNINMYMFQIYKCYIHFTKHICKICKEKEKEMQDDIEYLIKFL